VSPIDINMDGINDPFAVAAEGKYVVLCDGAEETTSKAGNSMIKTTFTIEGEGENAGKKIFENWVLEGDGARFGLWTFKQFCVAAGLKKLDEQKLIGKRFSVQIGVTPPSEGYDRESNGIVDVYGSA